MKFIPSTDWQEIPDGIAVPAGGEYRMNISTGLRQARWNDPPSADQVRPITPQELAHEFKRFTQIPRPAQQPAKTVTGRVLNREQIRIYKGKPAEKVVNSEDIKWEPIDRVAARVVAPAPWQYQPPEPEPKFMKPDEVIPPKLKTRKMMTEEGHVETMIKNDENFAQVTLDVHERDIKEGLKSTSALSERAQEAIAAVRYLSTEMQGPYAEFEEFIKRAIGTIRDQRMSLSTETRLLMNSLREVRQFFLEGDYEMQMRRLNEFVELCERLKVLKDSGFLDTVAETILKL
jgi:hypothetical protein